MKNIDFTVVKYRFYSDPGHGWLAVPKEHLQQLGITNKITGYSYQKGKTAYLEEDCDATTLFNAIKERIGNPNLAFQDIYQKTIHKTYSPIRNYDHYTGSSDVEYWEVYK